VEKIIGLHNYIYELVINQEIVLKHISKLGIQIKENKEEDNILSLMIL